MKIDCKIKSIGELRHGENLSTGNKWYFLPIEVEWNEPRQRSDGSMYTIDNSLVVDITGDYAKNFTLPVGQKVCLDLKCEAKDYNGRLFNNIRSSFIVLR